MTDLRLTDDQKKELALDLDALCKKYGISMVILTYFLFDEQTFRATHICISLTQERFDFGMKILKQFAKMVKIDDTEQTNPRLN